MDETFAQLLDEWTAFYALMGAAAVTLLGLLFIAVSLRLNIFHQANVEDVRDFAAVTMITFLMALAIAGLTLAPHQHERSLALVLFLIGAGGLFAVAWVVRVWKRLNPPQTRGGPGYSPYEWQGWAFIVVMALSYASLLGVAIFLWNREYVVLAGLAIIEAWLLVMGTIAAWITLSHAGGGGEGEPSGD